MTDARGLGPEEDGELRRLAALSEFGVPGGAIGSRMTELRARDRRSTVRAPRREDTSIVTEQHRP